MRKAILAAAPLILLAACDDGRSSRTSIREDDSKVLRAVSQLQCPDHQGALTRVRTAADGLSCDYAGPKGAEVTLRLIKLSAGDKPEDVLPPMEKELNGLMPGLAAKLAQGDAAAKQQAAEAERQAADADRKAADAERQAADAERRGAMADGETSGQGRKNDNVKVDMPGVHVKTKGDSARVNLPGLHVDANDKGAHIDIGGMHINADGKKGSGSANVQINSDHEDVTVRAQNDAAEVRSTRHGTGLRATYVLKDDSAPEGGWKMVGYEAWGPPTGPVVAAVVKSHDRHDDRIFRAAKALVKNNVGG